MENKDTVTLAELITEEVEVSEDENFDAEAFLVWLDKLLSGDTTPD